MFVITKEWMNEHRTERGAWTYVQMKTLGVRWPQPPGWLSGLIGSKITEEKAAAFVAGKHALAKSTIKRHLRQEIEHAAQTGATLSAEAEALKAQDARSHGGRLFEQSMPRGMSKKAMKKARKKARMDAFLQQYANPNKEPVKAPEPVRREKKKARQAPHRPLAYQGDVNSPEFLQSFEWRQLRMRVLVRYGRKCMCCGATPDTGAVMHVDHIKPRRLFPHLALDEENLQIACDACNHGKGNQHGPEWDFRPKQEEVDPEVVAMLREIAGERK